jgi:endonuclease I
MTLIRVRSARSRNATIFKRQGNCNPFIDHPEWLLDVAASLPR